MEQEAIRSQFAADFPTLLGRRRAIGLFAAAGGGIALSACRMGGGPPGETAEANVFGTAADGSSCVRVPGETAGPYPADGTNRNNGATVNVLGNGGVVRGDIRPSFDGMTPVATGVPLDLVLKLVSVGHACQPLAGHAIYLWHCDAAGHYSLYSDTDRNYLRGVGVSDATGQVTFSTIVPGTYDGRFTHIHFEAFAKLADAVSGKASVLTSQIVVPEAMSRPSYAFDNRYGGSAENLAKVTLSSDMVFGNNTKEQLAAQTLQVSGDPKTGFRGQITIGL